MSVPATELYGVQISIAGQAIALIVIAGLQERTCTFPTDVISGSRSTNARQSERARRKVQCSHQIRVADTYTGKCGSAN